MLFPKKKGFTQFPDKYETKYSDTPAVGTYDATKAIDSFKPRGHFAVIKKPLGLYRRAAEARPEVNDGWQKPLGSDAKGARLGPGL